MPRSKKLEPTLNTSEISERESSRLPISAVVSLTLRQVQVLRCVEQFFAVHGFPPSLRDLGLMLDMSSLAAITEHLQALVRKGYLEREAGERRAMRVLRPSDGAPIAEPRPLRKAPLCSHCKRRRVA